MQDPPANLSVTAEMSDMRLLMFHPVGAIPGDANLDGRFNSNDLVTVFSAGEYEDGLPQNSYWWEGDWDSDREFGTSDMIAAFQHGSYESAAAAVPESSGWVLALLGGLGLVRWRNGK